MDDNRLRHIVSNVQDISEADINALDDVVRQYPYFTVAQILLAVGMNLNEQKGFEKQLRLASAMTPDRNALRHLMSESKERVKTELPDEFVHEEDIIPEKTFIIPEIDLRGSQEELSKEMAVLEERVKKLA